MLILRALALVVVLGCHRSTPAPSVNAAWSEAGAAPITSSAPSASASAVPADPDAARVTVVTRWNDAHTSHDSKALEALYAPKVVFYGTSMTNVEAAKKKGAAFAASPDFTQLAGKPVFEASDAPGALWARFTKTTNAKGKATDYPVLLIIGADGRIIEEADDVTRNDRWCFKTLEGSPIWGDQIVWPFRISAQKAQALAFGSKHVSRQTEWPSMAADRFICAKRCAVPSRDCDFRTRLDDGHSTSPSSMIEWLNIDPITKKLYWESFSADGGAVWESEQL